MNIRISAGLAAVLFLAASPGGVDAAATGPPPTCAGEAATIVGTPTADRIRGTEGADVIVGSTGADVIDAGGGDDIICGNDGSDRIDGGAGDDRLVGGRGAIFDEDPEMMFPGDELVGGTGDDLIDPGDAWQKWPVGPDRISYTDAATPIAANLEDGEVVGDDTGTDRLLGKYELRGSAYGDTITGSRHKDRVRGGRGDDLIDGSGGGDELFDGAGDDTIFGRGGDDWIETRSGDDTVYGGVGSDSLDEFSVDSSDRLDGGAGRDFISTVLVASATQVVDGGPDHDYASLVWSVDAETDIGDGDLVTDLGTGIASVDGVAFRLHGVENLSAENSYGTTQKGSWTVVGTDGDEEIWAAFRTRMHATMLGGRDVVNGSKYDDYVDGGTGKDLVYPGDGHDTCIAVERQKYDDCETNR